MAPAPSGPTLGSLLRHYRRAAGLTQEELAERAGISQRSLGNMERSAAHRPRTDTLALLADALGLVPADRAALVEAAARLGPDAPAVPAPALATAMPLVGRQAELALLERHLAGEGPPLLLLAGEPGIGKTRLLHAALPRAVGAGLRVLKGGCQRQGGQEPYAPLLGALHGYLRLRRPAQLRSELAGCAWLVRLLPELAEGPIPPLPRWSLSPQQERRLMGEAVVRYLANVAGPGGTLLVLDDLQWASPDALELLVTLTRSSAEIPLRVLGAYRDTEVRPSDPLSTVLADLAHAGLAGHRLLPPLRLPEMAQLVESLLESMGDDHAALREHVVQRAGGVPFFVVSWVQALRAEALAGVPSPTVPWNLAQGIRQRVAALPVAAQDVLGIAAVAGRDTPRVLLLRVAARPEREALDGLQAACRARLLEEVGTDAYRFAHDVIREMVEADLGAAQRARIHREIATALEATPTPPVEALAHHYAAAAEHGKAAHWLERAGDQAAAGVANAAALKHYAAARVHLHAAGGEATARARLDEKLGDVRVLMGAYAQAQDDFAQARAVASDPARRAELGRKEGLAWHLLGEFEQALAAFELAVATEGADGDRTEVRGSVRIAIEVSRGEALWQWGHYDAAQQAAERALALLNTEAPGRDKDHALARADDLLGRVAWTRGDTARAEACHQRSLAIYERLGDQQGIATAWADLGRVAYQRGDLTQADECGQRSLTVYERIGDQHGIAWACRHLFWFGFLRGDLLRAEEYARRGLAINERSRQRDAAISWQDLAQVAYERGDLTGAEEGLRRALAILERSDQQGGFEGSASSWNVLGTVAVQRGALAEAETCYRHSLDILERTEASGFPGPISHAWQGLGRIACERGDLATAVTWYRRTRHLARRCGSIDVEALAALGLVCARLRGQPAGGRQRTATVLLEQGCAVATRHGLALPAVRAALLRAEVYLRQDALAEAQVAAETALELATSRQRRWEEGVARRLQGQCALAQHCPCEAEAHLRAALTVLTETGAALEAARTCLALAHALVMGTAADGIPTEASTLLAAAQAQFIRSGATLDLTQAQAAAAAWGGAITPHAVALISPACSHGAGHC